MEDRHDLELILLDGLSDTERAHIEKVIGRTTRAKLQRLRKRVDVQESVQVDR